jgi:uncharacterized protein
VTRPAVAWRWLVVGAITILGVVLMIRASYTDDALDLLPGKAVNENIRLLQELGLVNRVLVSLNLGPGPMAPGGEGQAKLKKSAAAIAAAMEKSGVFEGVIYKVPENAVMQIFASLQNRLPLLLDKEDLAELKTRLSAEEIDKALRADFMELNSPAGIALKNRIRQDPLGIDNLLVRKLGYLKAPFAVTTNEGCFLSRDGKSCLILAESRLDLTRSVSAFRVQKALDAAFKTGLSPGVQAQVIGTLPHTLANARSIKHDLLFLPLIATILLLILIIASLRSLRAFFVLAVPLAATPVAIGLTGLAFGTVNRIALGFGTVLLGIAVDYGIPLYCALARNPENRHDILHSHRKPFALAYLTTASVFVVLLFSEVPVQRQMAALALFGVTATLVYSWLIVPTIVPQNNRKGIPLQAPAGIPLPSASVRKAAILLWFALLAAGLLTWPKLHYNGDLRALDVPDKAIAASEDSFRRSWEQPGEQAFIVASGKSLDAALDNNTVVFQTLRENNALSFQSLAPILPSRGRQRKNLALWQEFWKHERPGFDIRFHRIADLRGFNGDGFTPFFRFLDTPPSPLDPNELLPADLRPLATALIHRPDKLHGDGNGHFLILTTANTGDDGFKALMDLDSKNKGIQVLANRKWRSRVEFLLRRDISSLCLAAAIVTIMITMISFPSPRAIAASLAPVASALSAMSLYSFISGSALNMMHLLMGIMVIGISVDYGIFVVCASREKVATISRFAISLCAVSTLFGFGVLAFAEHPALQSLGVTVLVGIGGAWPTALLISPIILGNTGAKGEGS